MIKKLIKSICLKIYEIGYFENVRVTNIKRKEQIDRMALIGEDVFLSEDCVLINNTHPKDQLNIGDRSRIMGNLFLFDASGEIQIGKDCFVGPQTRIWSAKKIQIGDRVLIAHNVNIHDNNSHPIDARIRYEENRDFVESGIHNETDLNVNEIIIEDDVWIGFNSIILKGVHIGRGAIIGAGSVVTNDIEPWTVNVGNPLRVVRKLEPVKMP